MKARFFLILTTGILSVLVPMQVYTAIGGIESEPQGAMLSSARKATVDLPVGTSASWWAAVQKDIRSSEYHITWQEKTCLPDVKASWQAPNRAHNLRTYFTPQGIRVIPHTSEKPVWTWGLGLKGYGFQGQVNPVTQPKLSVSKNRIEYARKDLTEWYVNDKRGLEQGFTLKAPPKAENTEAESWVVLKLDVLGDLDPTLNSPASAVEFITKGGVGVIHFGKLHAVDAAGKKLPTRFALAGRVLDIQVDTGGALYPITIDPLATSPSWTAESNQANAWFGYSVATAGDVNGDGCDDVIVSAPWYDMGQPNQGRVYVYHGSLWGLWDFPSWTAHGISGWSVATAGDVNDDGYSDVIIGTGRHVYVYYGSDTGLGETGTPDNADWSAETDQLTSFGHSVGTAGDVNGDGYDDIIVGDPYYTNGEYSEGAAFVYHGSASGLGAAGTPQNADWHYEGNQARAYFGHSVGSAGDVNGDGYGDVIVGAPDYSTSLGIQGQAFVFHGSASGLSSSPTWTAEGFYIGGDFGYSVGTAGDVNGDGYSDVIIGAPYEDFDNIEGEAFVYHGSSTGLDLNGSRPVGLRWNADWLVASGGIKGRFGWSVATAGDVDGDYYADVVVGAPHSMSGPQHRYGRSYMYRGSAIGLGITAAWSILSQDSYSDLGNSVGTAGDVNGDGYSDVIIGAPQYTNGESAEGRAFVYRGSRLEPPAVTSNNATGVSTDSATLNGRLDDLGTASSVKVFFEWGSATVGEVLATYGVGSRPDALAFDGTNIWVANRGSNNVMKLRASDGEILGTYPVGTGPQALAFDGANIWVAHSWYENNALRKIRASDGELLGTYPVGTYCYDLAFDGTHIWVTNGGQDTVMKLRASDGKLIGTYDVGDYPIALAFDGTYIWVANINSDNLMRLRANSGELVATYDVGDGPHDLAFEAGGNIFEANIWVANSRDNTVMKLNAYSGELVATYDLGLGSGSLVFDGVHMWAANFYNVMKLRASDGMLLGTYEAGEALAALDFDGTDIWVANSYSDNVMRLKASPYENITPAQTQTWGGAFSAGISGLDPETIYHFRARAQGDGTGYGQDTTFTFTPGPPVVTTDNATDVTSDSATLNGTLYYLGEVSSVEVSFEWGLDTSYGNETPVQTMTRTGPFKARISGLDPGSSYHFRAKAVGDGTGYGNDMTFVAQADEVWVDDDYTAEGYNDGHTWAQDAFSAIQEGIDTVDSPGTVHVAPGNYNENITMKAGVKILGAGAGYDPNIHSIIDGSGLWETLVTARNVNSSAKLDGFTITNGFGWEIFQGGGMHNWQSSPTVNNCIFSGNEAEDYGAGMNNSQSSPTVNNCTFSGNEAWQSGGGMYNLNSSPMVINCIFEDNSAYMGGGMYNTSSTPTVINCTFSGNSAGWSGGGIHNASSTPTMTNCILWGDTAGSSGDEIHNETSTPVITYSDIQLTSGTYTGTGNINADPLFVDSGGGDFHLQSGSPCIDAGDNTAVPAGVTTDIDGSTRFFDDPNSDDTGNGTPPIVDMGADEFIAGVCDGDFNVDGDVDGWDLAAFAAGGTGITLEDFAADFGRTNCP